MLRAAAAAPITPALGLRAWALAVQDRSNHSKTWLRAGQQARARIAYACPARSRAYDEARPNDRLARRKAQRLSFEMPVLAANA